VIGAHRLAGSRGACVINIGTTVTIDLIDGRGVHHGGAILPGPQLMVRSLLEGTAGIAERADETPMGQPSGRRSRSAGLFARRTKDAIHQGALYAVAAAVDRAVIEARGRLGTAPRVLLTGGGADQLERLICAPHVKVANLVLQGIAVHGGLVVRQRLRAAVHSAAHAAAPAKVNA
jgi:type III pantothenate kinase